MTNRQNLTCPACGAASPDGGLCAKCTGRLADLLRWLGELWTPLIATIDRQTRRGDTPSHTPQHAETPLPYRPDAADRRDDTARWLLDYTQQIAQKYRLSPPPNHLLTPPICAWWLANRVPKIRTDIVIAPALLIAAEWHTQQIEKVIDGPLPRRYLGPCPNCKTPRFADENDTTHTCTCGLTVTVQQALDDRQTMMDDLLLTWDELTTLSEIPPRTLRRWRKEHRLNPAASLGGREMWAYRDAKNLTQTLAPGRPTDTPRPPRHAEKT